MAALLGLGWSSLPADLVNRVADCLLATSDLDCYADMRAVCHHWRSSTADPGSNQHDPRFRPTRWVMLEEPNKDSFGGISDDGSFLFVNTSTGRFLRRRLPLLRDGGCYVFVTSTTDGLLVLAGRDSPYAVSILNPFTGSLIDFAAPLPFELQSRRRRPQIRLTADVVGSSPTLVLLSVARSWVCWAEPQSLSFSIDSSHGDCPASRLPRIAAAFVNRDSVPVANNIFDQLLSQKPEGCRCYAVELPGSGDMLAVLKRPTGIDVYKIDAAGDVIERVQSIGSQALFLGVRCLVVDTRCFPSVEPNCAYFQLTEQDSNYSLGQSESYIHKFNLGACDGEEDPAFVSPAMGSLGPFTLTQFLSNYTMDIPCHPLTSKISSTYTYLEDCGEDDFYDYIDYFDDESDYQPYGGYSDYDESDYEPYFGYSDVDGRCYDPIYLRECC